jgi:hypothetical protein
MIDEPSADAAESFSGLPTVGGLHSRQVPGRSEPSEKVSRNDKFYGHRIQKVVNERIFRNSTNQRHKKTRDDTKKSEMRTKSVKAPATRPAETARRVIRLT